jgi:hypothetical protein
LKSAKTAKSFSLFKEMWQLFVLVLASAEVWDIHFPRCVSREFYPPELTPFTKVNRFNHIQVVLDMSIFQGCSSDRNSPACEMTNSSRFFCAIRDKVYEYDVIRNSWKMTKQLKLHKSTWFNDEVVEAMRVFNGNMFILGRFQLIMCDIEEWRCKRVQYFHNGYIAIEAKCNNYLQYFTVFWTPVFGIFAEETLFDMECLSSTECEAPVVESIGFLTPCSFAHKWIDPRRTCSE